MVPFVLNFVHIDHELEQSACLRAGVLFINGRELKNKNSHLYEINFSTCNYETQQDSFNRLNPLPWEFYVRNVIACMDL